jgi:hypothetical protein
MRTRGSIVASVERHGALPGDVERRHEPRATDELDGVLAAEVLPDARR